METLVVNASDSLKGCFIKTYHIDIHFLKSPAVSQILRYKERGYKSDLGPRPLFVGFSETGASWVPCTPLRATVAGLGTAVTLPASSRHPTLALSAPLH